MIYMDYGEVELLTENTATGKKKHYIEGVFAEADTLLRNPRIYPRNILEREVTRYIRDGVSQGKAWGELGHRPALDDDESRFVMLIKELKWEGKRVLGRAVLLDNPLARTYLSMVEEGDPGVSTRGGGSVKGRIIQPNYYLHTWDAVGRPSANSVMRVMSENLDDIDINENELDQYLQIINNNVDRSEVIKENMVNWFSEFIKKKYL